MLEIAIQHYLVLLLSRIRHRLRDLRWGIYCGRVRLPLEGECFETFLQRLAISKNGWKRAIIKTSKNLYNGAHSRLLPYCSKRRRYYAESLPKVAQYVKETAQRYRPPTTAARLGLIQEILQCPISPELLIVKNEMKREESSYFSLLSGKRVQNCSFYFVIFSSQTLKYENPILEYDT